MELLAGSLALWAYNPGFPELVHLPLVALKKFVKGSPVERFRRQAKLLVDSVEATVKFVGFARDTVEFAPKDVAAVASFLRWAAPVYPAVPNRFAMDMAPAARQAVFGCESAQRCNTELPWHDRRGLCTSGRPRGVWLRTAGPEVPTHRRMPLIVLGCRLVLVLSAHRMLQRRRLGSIAFAKSPPCAPAL